MRFIKHSLPTAFRQAISNWEALCYRLAGKEKPPEGKLSCGLVGAGNFFNYAYLPALNRRDSPLVITGIFAREEKKFKAAQRGLRYATAHFMDYEALLASGISSVLILLPNHLHAPYARKALEHGVNVFCEKPLAPDVTGALALKAVVEQSGRVLMTDFNERYFDRNSVLKNVLAENLIGRVISARAFHNQDLRRLRSFAPLQRDLTGGGVIHTAGVHLINLLLHWLGDVDRVHAVFENRALPVECGEDTAHCRFWFRNGVTATLDASLANAVNTTYERVEFTGTEGELASDLKKCRIVCRSGTKGRLIIPCQAEITSDSVFNALAEFARAVRTGVRPETGIDDSIRTGKITEALTLSAQRGKEVHLDEIERKYAP